MIGRQSGICLTATCTPFDAIPPVLWGAFKKAVMKTAEDWGLTVHISEHPSIQLAENNFWKAHKIHEDAAVRVETSNG